MRSCLVLVTALALFSRWCSAQRQLVPAPVPLSLGPELSVTINGTVNSGGQAVYVLKGDTHLNECLGLNPGDNVANRYIHAELWNRDAMSSYTNGRQNTKNNLQGRADPMLMMANSRNPPDATYQTHQSDWIWEPDTTITDFEGYKLLRPYHHVSALVNGTASNSDPWYISISNIDIWMMHSFEYTLRVSCVEEKPCPSLSFSDTCSGHGQCVSGDCVCDVSGTFAWGDVACDANVERLQNGVAVKGSQSQGGWSYYAVQVPERSNMLLVEMYRMRGDPVLFVKHQDKGFASGGLPAVLDYENYADQESFRSRLNSHYISIAEPQSGIYYVGVYNNDVYIKEDASFEVSARWASEPVDGFCPADCNKPNGNCRNFGSGPTCQCEEGFGGKLCEGKSVVVELGAVVAGALDPADWVYYRLTVDSRNYRKWKEGLVVDFTTNDKGHPVLILKRDSYPSMLDNDYIFTSSQMLQGRKRFKLDETELPDGEYIFGIFNMDYYRHEQMEYKFMVSSTDIDNLMPFTPYMSIVLGVTVSLFLCLLMSICKRLIQRHGLFGHAPPEHLAQYVGSNYREQRGRGVDVAVVETFPSYHYKTPDGETGKPDTEDSEMNSDGLPSCAVCLCAYEEGEMMRRLPCNHEFHLKCIDQWLTQRITCPMCRVALVSEEQTETPGHVEQGARSPPASPPGSINMEPVERHDIELARVAVASSSTAQASTSSTSILPGTHGEYDVIVVSNVSSEDGQPHTR